MNPDDMGHKKHTEIGDFCQENLFGQVRQPQLIATKLDWLTQFYYDVFHCDKNHFLNMLGSITLDIHGLLGLSDALSMELLATHNLGNLCVQQSDECIKTIRGVGAIREKHTDITGGDRRRLTGEKVGESRELLRTAGVSDEFVAKHGTRPFAVLSPLIAETTKQGGSERHRRDTLKCFGVLHQLWTLFDASAALQNTVSQHSDSDLSDDHQELVKAFFDLDVDEVGSDLLESLNSGASYLKWPDHYMACHLSDDMRRFAKFSGNLPFGRTSNQVSEQ